MNAGNVTAPKCGSPYPLLDGHVYCEKPAGHDGLHEATWAWLNTEGCTDDCRNR